MGSYGVDKRWPWGGKCADAWVNAVPKAVRRLWHPQPPAHGFCFEALYVMVRTGRL
jgi:hypothetical protein